VVTATAAGPAGPVGPAGRPRGAERWPSSAAVLDLEALKHVETWGCSGFLLGEWGSPNTLDVLRENSGKWRSRICLNHHVLSNFLLPSTALAAWTAQMCLAFGPTLLSVWPPGAPVGTPRTCQLISCTAQRTWMWMRSLVGNWKDLFWWPLAVSSFLLCFYSYSCCFTFVSGISVSRTHIHPPQQPPPRTSYLAPSDRPNLLWRMEVARSPQIFPGPRACGDPGLSWPKMTPVFRLKWLAGVVSSDLGLKPWKRQGTLTIDSSGCGLQTGLQFMMVFPEAIGGKAHGTPFGPHSWSMGIRSGVGVG